MLPPVIVPVTFKEIVNAMKDLQKGEDPCIKKILVRGNPRYVITSRGKSELGKQNITQGIINQELTQNEVSTNYFENFFFNQIKNQVDVVRRSYVNPFKYFKLSGKKGEFYGKF